jgi:hypothetical protein
VLGRLGRTRLGRHDEQGSALFLVPAAVAILAVLGAIALNAGAVFLGQHQLATDAQTAAEDATGQLNSFAFYHSGTLSLDPATATRVADASIAAQTLSSVRLDGPLRVTVHGAQVCVSLTGKVPLIFGAGLPGVSRWISVSAHSTATAAGYLGPRVAPRTLC